MADDLKVDDLKEDQEGVVDDGTVDDVIDDVVDDEKDDAEDDDTVDDTKPAGGDLLSLLQNPQTQKQTILALAKQAGLLEAPAEKKKEEPPTVEEMLRQVLGDEYNLLPPKIGRALEKILEVKIKAVTDTLAESQELQIQRDAKNAEVALLKKYKDVSKYQNAMLQIMEQYHPAAGVSQSDYLEDVYLLAKAKAGKSIGEKAALQFANRVNRNAKDDDGKGTSNDSEPVRKSMITKLSLDDAITSAVRELKKGKK